jgi:Zn-dependent peptidase ImmA (M78 family)
MLRRGFKKQAENISAELRGELGLTLHERLDCTKLAKHLCIPVDPVSILARWGASESDLALVTGPTGDFSAMTQYRGTRCRIFFNSNHSPARTANSLAHELSHVILEHEPESAMNPDGTRNFNPVQEAEAGWQAGALLVPREGALSWLAGGRTVTMGARHFGVSVDLFTWRANQTGVIRQLQYRTRRAA